MTYCTPYLLQLGLSKAKLSLVWIAGPLSGLVMQPIVGVLADKSKSKWGRRRPVMIGGTAIVSVCLLVLGWTGEIVGAFVTDVEVVSAIFVTPNVVLGEEGKGDRRASKVGRVRTDLARNVENGKKAGAEIQPGSAIQVALGQRS